MSRSAPMIFGALLALSLAGCGSHSTQQSPPANNPVPAITVLSPSSVVEGAAAQTLTITGTNFLAASTVSFNGTSRAATFVSSTELTIALSAGDESTIGTYPVVVSNPTPGGGASNTADFNVALPPPSVTSLSPSSANVGAAAQTLTINGTDFVSGAAVTYNGVAHTVTFVSSSQLTIALTAADQLTAGIYPVVVTNPDQQSSSAADFTVDNVVPAITSLSPLSTFPCDPVPTLTINGSNFVSGATVTFGGTSKAVTFVNSTQLTIPLTSSDIATPGSYDVVVTSPTPGGGPSTAVAFTVDVPAGPTLAGTGPRAATLIVYAVNADGTSGSKLCTTSTDSQAGIFSASLDSAPSGPVRLVTTGGQIAYSFVSNGAAVQAALQAGTSSGGGLSGTGRQSGTAAPMPAAFAVGGGVQTILYPETGPDSALLDGVPGGGQSGIEIGMPSTFVDSLLQGDLAHGKTANVTAAHASATQLIDGLYGFSGTIAVELIGTSGSDGPKRTTAESAVFAEALSLNLTSPGDLRGALASDISDGTWDGLAFGTAVSLESTNLSATAGTTDFLDSTVSWVNSSASAVLPLGTTAPTASMVKGVTACSCTPFGVGLAPGNTGAIAPLAFNGHQYLFIAAGSGGVVAVNVSDPTATSPSVKAWPSVASTIFGGTGVSGVAAVVGNANHPQIFAFTGSDQQVALLNAVTLVTGNPSSDNPKDFQGQLSFNNGKIQLSGNTWWITGAFWDGCWEGCRVILSTADGYTSFNTSTNQLDETFLFPVDDSGERMTGNMGPDIFKGISVANPAAATDRVVLAGNMGGIQLADFSAGASFYIPFNSVLNYFPDFPGFPSVRYEDADGNAMDPAYQVGLLTPEGVNSVVGLMNLNGITETTGGTAAQNTFAPAGTAEVQLAQAGFAVEGSSIDPTTHTALLEGPGLVMTVAQIQDPGAVAGGQTWSGFSDWSFYTLSNSASLNGFTIPNSDIHGVSTITSLGTVKLSTSNVAYGYLLDQSNTKLLQVDLGAFLNLARQGASGDALHQPAGDPTSATDGTTGGAVVQEISW
jgi:IPT/TIG domain